MNNRFVVNFLKGSASTFLGNISSILFHFLTIMVITRSVNKTDFGIYLLVLVITQGLKLFSSLGLDLTLVKFITEENRQTKYQLFTSIIIIRFVLILIFTMLTLAFGKMVFVYFDGQVNQYMFYILVIFALANIRELMFHFLQGEKLFSEYAVVQLFSAVLKFCSILVALALFKLSIENLLLVEIIVLFISLVLQSFYVRLNKIFFYILEVDSYKKILKFSFPIYLNNMIHFVHGRTSVLMVAALLTPVHVAYLEIATKIPEALTRLFKSFIVVYFPNLSALFAQGNDKDGEKLMNKSLVLLSHLILPVVLIGFLFRNEITIFLFSREYVLVSFALFLLLLKFYFQTISRVLGYSLVSLGRPSVPAKITIVSSILHLLLSFPFIKIYGFIGAVYSGLMVSIFSQVFYLSFFRERVKPDIRTYLKPFAMLLVTIFIYWLIGSEFFLIKFFYILIYLLLNWSFIKNLRFLWHTISGHLHEYKLQVKSG